MEILERILRAGDRMVIGIRQIKETNAKMKSIAEITKI